MWRELARLIRSVPRGGRIDGHIFSITGDRSRIAEDAVFNSYCVWSTGVDKLIHAAPVVCGFSPS